MNLARVSLLDDSQLEVRPALSRCVSFAGCMLLRLCNFPQGTGQLTFDNVPSAFDVCELRGKVGLALR